MYKLINIEKNLDWITGENIVATYLSNEIPNIVNCPSAYAIVFKDGAILQTELREGERPTRRLDIPGGHVDEGETIEESVIRETFEETGVHIKILKLVGYKKVTVTSPKPENFRYPYPTGYMAFYLCEIVEETDFKGNNEVHGRVWLKPEELDKSQWCVENKIFLDEIKLLI